MKIAYFDCFSGASGDMILGALMDAGLPPEVLKKELAKLHLNHFDLQVKKVLKKGIGGSQAIVILDNDPLHYHEHESRQHHQDSHHHHGETRHHHHKEEILSARATNNGQQTTDHQPTDNGQQTTDIPRNLNDIREIIEKSDLEDGVKERSIKIFIRLAEAEAKIHQTDIKNIHFHEVGAMDAIIDVVGGVAGLAALGIERVYCSPLHVGTGTVKCAHGTLPVPAPATAELIRGKPVYSTGVQGELLTPTGAAILTTLSSDFGPMPAMTVQSIGYGAGISDPDIPNLLRLSVGEAPDETHDYEAETAAVIETSIDDMNPQIYGYLIQRLLDMGVMDTFLTPLQMKKNRPGTLLTVICKPDMVPSVSDFIMRETTTLGLRWRTERRIKASRAIQDIPTRYGNVRFKAAYIKGQMINAFPEYEDCRRISAEKKIPLKDVMEEVRRCILEAKYLLKLSVPLKSGH